jgi:hypothetical protein
VLALIVSPTCACSGNSLIPQHGKASQHEVRLVVVVPTDSNMIVNAPMYPTSARFHCEPCRASEASPDAGIRIGHDYGAAEFRRVERLLQ